MRPKILIILASLLIKVQVTFATVIAILEVTPSNEDVDLSISEFRYLTDELRSRAVATLPRDKFTVLTRDGLFALLPPDEAERECLAEEGCAVAIGRVIGAEYVTQGQIGVFAGQLTLTVELFESMSGKLLGSFVGESDNARGLLEKIRTQSPALFERIMPSSPEPELAKTKEITETPTAEPQPPEPQAQPQTTPHSPLPTLLKNIGFTAKIGFAKSGYKDGKSGLAYSLGLVAVKNFGFLDFVPELLISSEEFEINETQVSGLNFEIPLTARVYLAEDIGISLGAIVGIPLTSKFGEYENPKDLAMFGIAATGGLTYKINNSIFVNASYIKYFTERFTSMKNSKTDKVLCGIGYLL
ncbi:MAG: PorT family protein [Fibromonadaceae bacterium]|jgi:TolB-like protein|nr:PorT family protein [Fibromonadaceae bacterium]